jgi:uncharacterized protein YbjT (DUF2867 family)
MRFLSTVWLAIAIAVLVGCATTRPVGDPSKPLVLVAGATGGTGQEVIEQALAKGYRVRALVRDDAKARTLFGDRVQYALGDVREPRTLRGAVKGADYVISALGANAQRDPENSPERVDYQGVKSLAEAAKAAGVKHFVLVSSMGVTHPEHELNKALDNILQWKLKGEQALRATGINYTIVRPGGLSNEPGGREGLKVMQGDIEGSEGRISRADVASVLVNTLGRPEAYDLTFEIVGDAGAPRIDWASLYQGLKRDVG